MTEEKVYFKNSFGQKICGLLAIPSGEGPFPAVVGCHGFRSIKDRSKLTELAKRLTENGIVLLRIDLTDIGESEPKFEETTLRRDADAVLQAIEYLKTRNDVDCNRIGLYGSSMGGITVIIAGSGNSDVKAMALAAPVTYFDYHLKYPELWADMIKQGYSYTVSSKGIKYKLKKQFVDQALTYDTDSLAEDISCPIIVVHGTADESVRFEHSKKFFSILNSEKKFVEIDGCNHFFELPEHFEKLISSVVEFFVKNL